MLVTSVTPSFFPVPDPLDPSVLPGNSWHRVRNPPLSVEVRLGLSPSSLRHFPVHTRLLGASPPGREVPVTGTPSPPPVTRRGCTPCQDSFPTYGEDVILPGTGNDTTGGGNRTGGLSATRQPGCPSSPVVLGLSRGPDHRLPIPRPQGDLLYRGPDGDVSLVVCNVRLPSRDPRDTGSPYLQCKGSTPYRGFRFTKPFHQTWVAELSGLGPGPRSGDPVGGLSRTSRPGVSSQVCGSSPTGRRTTAMGCQVDLGRTL